MMYIFDRSGYGRIRFPQNGAMILEFCAVHFLVGCPGLACGVCYTVRVAGTYEHSDMINLESQ